MYSVSIYKYICYYICQQLYYGGLDWTVAASSPPLLPLGKQSPKQNCKEWGVWQGEQGKEGNILDVCIYVHMCSQCCIVFFGYPDWTVPNEPEFQMYNNLLFSLSPIACLGNTFQSSSRFLKVSFHSRKSDFRVRVYTFKMYINVFIVFSLHICPLHGYMKKIEDHSMTSLLFLFPLLPVWAVSSTVVDSCRVSMGIGVYAFLNVCMILLLYQSISLGVSPSSEGHVGS